MEIESFFFISLAVTFVLLVALVYHFRQKFITLDQRVNNVIEIMNTVVKEMQNLKLVQDKYRNNMCCMPVNSNEYINIPADSFLQTKNLGTIQTQNLNFNNEDSESDSGSDDSDSESDDSENYENKIVVSDDEEEDNLEILDITDISDNHPTEQFSQPVLEELLESEILPPEITIISNTDYRKMDISQLRSIALEKGIDGKKMKKNELVKILENV